MSESFITVERLVSKIQNLNHGGARHLVALVGPPASGKSTLAESLASALSAQIMPMDGFHLDNRVLTQRGLLERKGAPDSFDVAGFGRALSALRQGGEVIVPVFDRDRDIAIAGAEVIPETCRTIIVEGNYLLLDSPGWRDLAGYWDITVELHVPLNIVKKRLMERWLGQGLDAGAALARTEGNDLKNARLIAEHSLPADYRIQSN